MLCYPFVELFWRDAFRSFLLQIKNIYYYTKAETSSHGFERATKVKWKLDLVFFVFVMLR